jgi:hypothetical protein
MLRGVMVAAAMLAAVPAMAGEMSGDEAKRWVTGKLFSYNCFEGTRGAGRVFADGSVIGTIQFQGSGPVRRAFLPANTLHVKGGVVCATVKGLPIEPCFNLIKTDTNSFRGAISGLGFAYCDFKNSNPRALMVERVSERPAEKPMTLRPSLSAAE